MPRVVKVRFEAEFTSATLVATTIFHFEVGAKTMRCSELERLAWRGNMEAVPDETFERMASMHCRISCTPGRNTRMPPSLSAVVMM